MHLLQTIRRVLDALATATAVVVGLAPDPSRIQIERDHRLSR